MQACIKGLLWPRESRRFPSNLPQNVHLKKIIFQHVQSAYCTHSWLACWSFPYVPTHKLNSATHFYKHTSPNYELLTGEMGSFKCSTTGWRAKQYDSYVKAFHPFCILYHFAYSSLIMFLTLIYCILSKRLYLFAHFYNFKYNCFTAMIFIQQIWLQLGCDYSNSHANTHYIALEWTTDSWHNMIGLVAYRSHITFCLMYCPQNWIIQRIN